MDKTKKIEMLKSAIESLQSELIKLENNQDELQKCKYMKSDCKCKSDIRGIAKNIKCLNKEVPEEFAITRNSVKCSISSDSTGENGLQHCKYYERREKKCQT